MLKFANLKLYRKFLILAVMVGSLFVLSSNRHVRAEDPCCEACNATAVSCVEFCYSDQIKPWMVAGCLSDCEAARVACRHACTPQGAPEVCNEF